jgi:ABC-type nitrate/sulfonate/bicarbonate transport system ATPase subunit
LADEPFAPLDYHRREQLNYKFLQLAKQACATILMVTHDVVEALRFSTSI